MDEHPIVSTTHEAHELMTREQSIVATEILEIETRIHKLEESRKILQDEIDRDVAELCKIQDTCPHDGPRIQAPPNKKDKSGSGGLGLVLCAICKKVLHTEV